MSQKGSKPDLLPHPYIISCGCFSSANLTLKVRFAQTTLSSAKATVMPNGASPVFFIRVKVKKSAWGVGGWRSGAASPATRTSGSSSLPQTFQPFNFSTFQRGRAEARPSRKPSTHQTIQPSKRKIWYNMRLWHRKAMNIASSGCRAWPR